MAQFWKHVNKVIKEAEIIIEVLDARLIEESRNQELEDKIEKMGKTILYVINKSDLVGKKNVEKYKRFLKPCIFISSKDKQGTTILKKKILELSRGNAVTVGVVGYPNVGKSSLINSLSGRGAARTSTRSGFTKGVQKIRVDNKIMILDTPGVFPYKEKDQFKHGKTGAIDYSQLKDPEIVALKFIIENKDMIKKHYNLESDDPEDILEEIAYKLKRLLKGNKPDLESTSRALLKDWQTGKMVVKS